MPFGRIYDVGVTVPIGTNQLETMYFTANTAGGWPDTTGSNTEFLLLPFNGGSITKAANDYSLLLGAASVSTNTQNNLHCIHTSPNYEVVREQFEIMHNMVNFFIDNDNLINSSKFNCCRVEWFAVISLKRNILFSPPMIDNLIISPRPDNKSRVGRVCKNEVFK